MYDPDKRKILSGLSHSSIFFSSLVVSVGIPIAVLIISDDPVVKDNAKEAINFHFNVWIYESIIAFLVFTIIGIPFAWILAPFFLLYHWVFPVLAILQVLGEPEKIYRYPVILRLL